VIVEVNFRLHPVEEHVRTWTGAPAGAACTAFAEPLRALMDSQIVPSGVQVRVSTEETAVDVRVAGLPECLDEYGSRVRGIFGTIATTDSAENVWAARQALHEKKDALVVKVSVLPSEICAVAAELREWSGSAGADVDIVAQATGLMTAAIAAAPQTALGLFDRLRSRATASGGSTAVLHVPDLLRKSIDAWGPNGSALPLMREIKNRFDSKRILNPGRFVGNI